MGLAEYRKKRSFGATPEPRGKRRAKSGRSFVVQKHAARALHYDFRLESDGVLKSWAVPKGPSLDPSVKRLAMATEDHPIEYGDFEGTIPPKQYGAGTVMVWDRGTWEPDSDARAALARGSLTFTLHGAKLKGRWHLVRSGGRSGDDRRWLLFKGKDEHARSGEPIVDERPLSALTARSLERIARDNDRVWSSRREQAPGRSEPTPDFMNPELATLVSDPPEGGAWVHEIKLDGYRMIAHIRGDDVSLFSRNGNDWTSRMPHIASALRKLGTKDAVLDGEVVVFDEHGVTDFQALQNALTAGRDGDTVYCVFDLLRSGGRDLRRRPLLERKAALRDIVGDRSAGILRFSRHVRGHGAVFFEKVREIGVEGMVSKRADSPYRSGRTGDWLKAKAVARDTFLVGGFTAASGAREDIGALLLGTRERRSGPLRYVGKVGTGFSRRSLAELHSALAKLERDTSPFHDSGPKAPRGARWVEPRLVVEIEYAEMTRGGVLRHPRFRGVRVDKPPADVKRDRALRPAA